MRPFGCRGCGLPSSVPKVMVWANYCGKPLFEWICGVLVPSSLLMVADADVGDWCFGLSKNECNSGN